MKRIETISLTFALLALATVPAVQAQENRPLPRVAAREAGTSQATPFILVNLASRGYFENFPNQVSLLKADATDLVEAGIDQGKVAPETLNNPGYLKAVAMHLKIITNSR